MDQPHPYQIGQAIDAICDHAERMKDERELADRLAESLDRTLQLMAESGDSPPEAEIDLAAWKEARSGTV